MANYWHLNSEGSPFSNGTGATTTPIHYRHSTPVQYSTNHRSSGTISRSNRPRSAVSKVAEQTTCGCTHVFVHFVLFIFNFILFASGAVILAVCFLYGTDQLAGLDATRRWGGAVQHLDLIRGLLPLANLLNLVHFSMICCGLAACLIAFVHFWWNCFSTLRGGRPASAASQNSSRFSTSGHYSGARGVPRYSRTSAMVTEYLHEEEELSYLRFTTQDDNDNITSAGYRYHDFDEYEREKGSRRKEVNRESTRLVKHSTCSLGTFIFMLVLLLAFQLMVGILAFTSVLPYGEQERVTYTLIGSNDERNLTVANATLASTLPRLEDFMKSTHRYLNYSLPIIIGDERVRTSFGRIEQRYRCCGVNDFEDYRNLTAVPDSCCKTLDFGCGFRRHPSNIFYDGCWLRMSLAIRQYLAVLGSLAIGLSFVPIFGLLFACCLFLKAR